MVTRRIDILDHEDADLIHQTAFVVEDANMGTYHQGDDGTFSFVLDEGEAGAGTELSLVDMLHGMFDVNQASEGDVELRIVDVDETINETTDTKAAMVSDDRYDEVETQIDPARRAALLIVTDGSDL